MATIIYTLADARVARREQISQAKAAYERALTNAGAQAATRIRAADAGWKSARAQAHRVAVLRARLCSDHRALASPELRLRLAIHEARLMPDYRPVPTSAVRRDETWFVRMIRSELLRRGVITDAALQARRAERMRSAERAWETRAVAS